MRSLKPICLVMVLVLAGCARQGGKKPTSPPPARPAENVETPVKAVEPAVVPSSSRTDSPASTEAGLTLCDRELRALKRVDARRYAQRRTQFDRLMSGASLYADIRTDVTGGTREAVDAMYRFRMVKLCAEISKDVLEALTRQNESVATRQN
ncbi:hypothetical protein DO628_24775 [Salmonella enterica subsp. salamae]|nr:hypothetical protein [Salmonella enterica subsp. salamae serovar Sofia]EBS4543925.1 hypothetical protein [Salmonella enterica subsp. salamae serovar Sofia]